MSGGGEVGEKKEKRDRKNEIKGGQSVELKWPCEMEEKCGAKILSLLLYVVRACDIGSRVSFWRFVTGMFARVRSE